MSRAVSLAALLVLIVLLGSTFYRVISPFLLPMFLAAVLAVICQPMQNYFLTKTGGRKAWAAALTTGTVTFMVVGPLVLGTFVAATNLYDIADQRVGGDWRRSMSCGVKRPCRSWEILLLIPGGLSDEKLLDLEKEFSDNIRSVATQLAGTTFTIASSTVGMFVSLAIGAGAFLTALYYFLADGPSILSVAEELIPLPVDHQRKLADRFARTVRAVVTATFTAAFAQGIATAVALQVCGIGHFVIFVMIGSVAALIPLAGTWMVWGPCAVWLALKGDWGTAIGLTIWGVAVVGMLDNLVKMYVLQSEADLHPLIAFISVIGALQVMGLWGIFIGPIVASCLFALIQLFNEELKEMAKDREAKEAVPPGIPIAAIASPPLATPEMTISNAVRPESTSKPGRKRRR